MLTETVLFMVLAGNAATVWSLPLVAWQRAVFSGRNGTRPFSTPGAKAVNRSRTVERGPTRRTRPGHGARGGGERAARGRLRPDAVSAA